MNKQIVFRLDQIRNKPDCIQELITNQVIQETCEFTTVTLTKEAMEKLDDKHYALSFPQQIKEQLICWGTLQGNYQATIPAGCRLKSEHFTIANDYNEVKGQSLKLMKMLYNALKQSAKATHINLKYIDIQGLHDFQGQLMIESPIRIDEV